MRKAVASSKVAKTASEPPAPVAVPSSDPASGYRHPEAITVRQTLGGTTRKERT